MNPVSSWTFADPDHAGGWAYVVYDRDGLPHYGTAPTQVEATGRARKLARELERPVILIDRQGEAGSVVVLTGRPTCSVCRDRFDRPNGVDGTREAALRHGWREEPAGLVCADCAWMRSGPVPVAA